MLAQSTELRKKAEQRAKELEKRMQNGDAYRESEMKNAEKQLTAIKKRIETSAKSLHQNQQVNLELWFFGGKFEKFGNI